MKKPSEHHALKCQDCEKVAARIVTYDGGKMRQVCVDHYIDLSTQNEFLIESVKRINYR